MFRGETHRAVAVLGGAYLEALLDRVLRSCLIVDANVERLFANANQKVQLAFALGLLTPQQRTNILKLQKVRNHFGHHVLDATDFDHPDVIKDLDTISVARTWRNPHTWRDDGKVYGRRDIYLMSVLLMAEELKRLVLPERDDATKREEATLRLAAFGMGDSILAALRRPARKG
jgi:hypothetical protein